MLCSGFSILSVKAFLSVFSEPLGYLALRKAQDKLEILLLLFLDHFAGGCNRETRKKIWTHLAREKTIQGEQKEVITVSNMTTAEAGRNSRETTKCLRDAGIKEPKREDIFSELERSVNCQAVIFRETSYWSVVEQRNFICQKLEKPLGQNSLLCLSQERNQWH